MGSGIKTVHTNKEVLFQEKITECFCRFQGCSLSQHISLAGLCESALADKLGYGP